MLEELIASGRIADFLLAAIAAEVAVLGYVFWRRGQNRMLLSFIASSLAGALLVLALREALQQSGWLFVAIYLFAALLAHLAETVLRLLPAAHDTDHPAKDLSQTP